MNSSQEATLARLPRLAWRQRAVRAPQGDGVGFSSMLERMTEIIAADGPSYLDSEVDPRSRMTGDDVALLESPFEHLSELCAMAKQLQLPLLLDAEQSNRQPAIDFMCRRLQQRFNVSGGAGAHGNNIIYNTFQMYMVGAERRLARDLCTPSETTTVLQPNRARRLLGDRSREIQEDGRAVCCSSVQGGYR